MIFTFYSFKGGVGRSMALANVGQWLFQKGLRVLMVDWDLEAPGLESFFYSSQAERETVRAKIGLIDILMDYRRQFPDLPLPASQRTERINTALLRYLDSDGASTHGLVTYLEKEVPIDANAIGRIRIALEDQSTDEKMDFSTLQQVVLGNMPPIEETFDEMLPIFDEYLPPMSHIAHAIHPADKSDPKNSRALWLLTAGWRSDDRFGVYAQQVQGFNWAELYDKYAGEAYFEWMRRQFLELADVVLIDSRTGVTEMGGVSTRQLADVVVSFCAPNLQNLEGIVTMTRSFRRKEVLERRGRPLETIIVPTRLDRAQIESRNEFEERFRAELDVDEFKPKAFRRAKTHFWNLGIPYVAKYSYIEKLAIGDESTEFRAKELEEAYQELAVSMALLSPEGSPFRRHVGRELRRQFVETQPRVFILQYEMDAKKLGDKLRERLEESGISVWPFIDVDRGDESAWRRVRSILDQAEFFIIPMTPATITSDRALEAWDYARRIGICVIPVRQVPPEELKIESTPRWIREYHVYHYDKEWESLVSQLRSPCQAIRVPSMAPPLPTNYVPRPAAMDQLVNLLLDSDAKKENVTTVTVKGMGGSGKSVLAASVCRSPEIVNAFSDGILWVSLGLEPDLLMALSDLYVALTGEVHKFEEPERAISELDNLLADKDCLLVVDDVWKPDDLRWFLGWGKKGARLITTRNQLPVSPDAKLMTVGSMTPPEATQLLISQWKLPIDVQIALELADRLDFMPLALDLAAAAAKQRIAQGDDPSATFQYLNELLDRQGVVALDRLSPVIQDQTIAGSIEPSWALLTDEERDQLFELASQAQSTELKRAEVGVLLGLDHIDTDIWCQRMDGFSLLEYDLKSDSIHVPRVVRDYLRQKTPAKPTPPTDMSEQPTEEPAGCRQRLSDVLGIPIILIILILALFMAFSPSP